MEGFKIESGGSLSPKLLALTDWFLDLLKEGRASGNITPRTPLFAMEIVRRIESEMGIKCDDSEIQALTNYWRRQYEPIATGGKGYFYAIHKEELDSTVKHLRHRIAGTQIALSCVLKAQAKLDRNQGELFDGDSNRLED